MFHIVVPNGAAMLPVPAQGMIIVDEATNISDEQWARILEHVRKRGFQLVIPHDPRKEPRLVSMPSRRRAELRWLATQKAARAYDHVDDATAYVTMGRVSRPG